MPLMEYNEERHYHVISLTPPFDTEDMFEFAHQVGEKRPCSPVDFDKETGELRVEFEGLVITTPRQEKQV